MIQVQASGDALGQNTKGHRGLLLSGLPHHSPAVARDLLLFFCGDNLDFVCSEAEKFEAVCNRGTNVIAVFSDPTGEDEKVHPTEQSRVCTDYLAYRNGEHIQRKRGVWIVGAGAIFKRLHIAFAGGEGEEAALMIDEIFHLVGAELLRAKKIDKDPGSRSPDRVPIGIPPVGVRPMVVSIDTRLRRAQRLAPLPRCAKMARSGSCAPK